MRNKGKVLSTFSFLTPAIYSVQRLERSIGDGKGYINLDSTQIHTRNPYPRPGSVSGSLLAG